MSNKLFLIIIIALLFVAGCGNHASISPKNESSKAAFKEMISQEQTDLMYCRSYAFENEEGVDAFFFCENSNIKEVQEQYWGNAKTQYAYSKENLRASGFNPCTSNQENSLYQGVYFFCKP